MSSKQTNESSPLLLGSTKTSSRAGRDRQKFLHEAISLFLFFGIETVLLAIGGATIWSGAAGPIVGVIWFFVAIQSIFLLLCFHGMFLWNQGDLPMPREEDDNECVCGEARFVTSANGRKIEYFTWGSEKEDAIVTVVLHGSNSTGKYFSLFAYPHQVMKDMNVRVISPSYPGHGGSDSQPHRRIKNWPKDDLEPILNKERVNKFIVQGSSYGTAHAMATSAYYSTDDNDRCMAVGLNVPYLPEPICREFGFHTDADYVLDEAKLSKPWILLPVSSLLWMFQNGVFSLLSSVAEGKEAIKRNMAIVDVIRKDCKRSFARGVIGQVYEMLNGDTNQQWIDPRTEMSTPIISVWYAEDDTICPPDHGKWLADVFQAKQGVETNVRVEKKGLGHLTYFTQEDTETGIQTKVLLEMLQKRK